jgi:putative membrane protein
MQSCRYSNTDAVFYLIINLIRTVLSILIIESPKNGSLLFFGLLSTKSTILKPEKVQIVTVTRIIFKGKWIF